jgi:hypothetical protein
LVTSSNNCKKCIECYVSSVDAFGCVLLWSKFEVKTS